MQNSPAHGLQLQLKCLCLFPLSHLKEVSGSSKLCLSKFLLSNSSCDKQAEMLRNATPWKPQGQERLWLISLRDGGGFRQADLQAHDPPARMSCRLSQRGLPLKYHLAVTNYS
jgi:hypothetical protein